MVDAKTRHVLGKVRPSDRAQLRGWLGATLGIDVAGSAREVGHASALDYLEHVFFERPGDVVVWANRGGGKTFYGAVATLLDVLFKPGIEVRLLGGSMEQSRKMYGYLRWMLERPGLEVLVDGKITERGVRLKNGSVVELLAQSQTSVRGHRVQKLRCDEVELFDRDVWEAAQFVTRSKVCGDVKVRGSVEALSTAHRPLGLMSELVDAARERESEGGEGWQLFCWNALDVMGVCDAERDCAKCVIESSCQGRAKNWEGFLEVEDVLSQRRRSSKGVFDAEMLCKRASRRDAVFSSFDADVHVRAVEPAAEGEGVWMGGMDFGMRSPFVMLWAQTQEGGRRVVVFDEYVQSDGAMAEHMMAMEARGWPRVKWVGADPAGHQREQVTGRTVIGTLRDAGWIIRTRPTKLAMGLETVQRWLENPGVKAGPDPGVKNNSNPGVKNPGVKAGLGVSHHEVGDAVVLDELPALVIHPRCKTLIESMTCYHFDMDDPRSVNPVKDGYDHAADALRYMLMNLENVGAVDVRKY